MSLVWCQTTLTFAAFTDTVSSRLISSIPTSEIHGPETAQRLCPRSRHFPLAGAARPRRRLQRYLVGPGWHGIRMGYQYRPEPGFHLRDVLRLRARPGAQQDAHLVRRQPHAPAERVVLGRSL